MNCPNIKPVWYSDVHCTYVLRYKLILFFRTLCPAESSRWSSALSKTQIQINFERCLHQTDWSQAERWIARATADSDDLTEPLLMQWQLAICQGDSESAANIGQRVRAEFELVSGVVQVRVLILEAELACLNKDYACKLPFLYLDKVNVQIPNWLRIQTLRLRSVARPSELQQFSKF